MGIEPDRLENADKKSPLTKYIKSGRIYFYRGQFKGKFNATIAKELRKLGAKYNRKQGSYDLLASQLPKELITTIEASEKRFIKSMEKISKKLAEINPDNIVEKLDITKIFDKQIFETNDDIEKKVKSIGVKLKLTPDERKEISEQYNDNMKLYIKEWTESEIKNLRKAVTKNVKSGIRYEEIIKDIQERYGVSKSKAKFLARQETNLLTTELSMQRAKKAGATHYIWRNVIGSSNHPVRASHKALNGKKIAFDNPPVVDQKTGRKAHAGQDFNCRCFQEVIIEF